MWAFFHRFLKMHKTALCEHNNPCCLYSGEQNGAFSSIFPNFISFASMNVEKRSYFSGFSYI
jgi:hypothetical protein